MLTILCTISIIVIAWLCYGIYELKKLHEYGVFVVSMALLIVIVFVGWFLIGTTFAIHETYTDITEPVFLSKSPTTAYVEYKNIKLEFSDAASYNAINSNTKFQMIKGYNMYNQLCFKSIVIKKDTVKTEVKPERENEK